MSILLLVWLYALESKEEDEAWMDMDVPDMSVKGMVLTVLRGMRNKKQNDTSLALSPQETVS